MSIEITLICDAYGCARSIEIQDTSDADIKRAQFHTDPDHGEYHYCSKCWPQVMADIAEDIAEDI